MVLQTSGSAIKFSEIQSEFGGTNPISLSEYYIGGDNVPATITGGGSPGTFTAFFGRTSNGGGGSTISTPNDGKGYFLEREIDASDGSISQLTTNTGSSHIYILKWESVQIFRVDLASNVRSTTFPGSVNGSATNSVTMISAFNSALNAANEVIFSAGGFDYQIGSTTFHEFAVFEEEDGEAPFEHFSYLTVRRRTSSTQTTSSVNPNVPASGEVSISDYYGGRDD
tara:strand:- start:1173 stop:1850 length:678 start_codon:yes stop_codon:yes gene_type:complete